MNYICMTSINHVMLITIHLKEINFRYLKRTMHLDDRNYFDVSFPSPISQAVELVRCMRVGYPVCYPSTPAEMPTGVQQLNIFDDQPGAIREIEQRPASHRRIVYPCKMYMENPDAEIFDAWLSPKGVVKLNIMIYNMIIKEMRDLAAYTHNKQKAIRHMISYYNFDGVINEEGLRKALYRSYIAPSKPERERRFEARHLELSQHST